ncbi:hypothetical protein [Variovorax sp. CY25R-8]|nr:hypothetical protein [Variovorax sp. CY25R-8]MCT8176430.1 hypothetical protein [Variovorax sp. CY25R-8]
MDLDADIVPGESLGGLRLKDRVLEVMPAARKRTVRKNGEVRRDSA